MLLIHPMEHACKEAKAGVFLQSSHPALPAAMVNHVKTFNREDMVQDNIELLNLYQEIYDTISKGTLSMEDWTE